VPVQGLRSQLPKSCNLSQLAQGIRSEHWSRGYLNRLARDLRNEHWSRGYPDRLARDPTTVTRAGRIRWCPQLTGILPVRASRLLERAGDLSSRRSPPAGGQIGPRGPIGRQVLPGRDIYSHQGPPGVTLGPPGAYIYILYYMTI
jgi:hypothetical protein